MFDDQIQNFFDLKQNKKKMSLSVQRSAVESFKFNGKHVRSVYVKGVGQCLVPKDVYEAIGYEKEDEAKAVQPLVPEKYKIRLGDNQIDLRVCPHPTKHLIIERTRSLLISVKM